MIETGDRITRTYQSFRGVDFRGEEVNYVRSPDSKNVWKDYKNTESIRTRPGMRKIYDVDCEVEGVVRAVHFFKDQILLHVGTELRLVELDATENARSVTKTFDVTMNDAHSESFAYGRYLYIKDGLNYFRYDGTNVVSMLSKDGSKLPICYIPTTSIGRSSLGGGAKIHEDVNMLTGWRKNTFRGDGKSTKFYIDGKPKIASSGIARAKVDGQDVSVSVVQQSANQQENYGQYYVQLSSAPKAPKTDGQDNVEITYLSDVDQSDRVLNARCFKCSTTECSSVETPTTRTRFGSAVWTILPIGATLTTTMRALTEQWSSA